MLALIVDCLSNVQIAYRLVITVATVRYHVSTLFSKVGTTSRAEAAAMAIKRKTIG